MLEGDHSSARLRADDLGLTITIDISCSWCAARLHPVGGLVHVAVGAPLLHTGIASQGTQVPDPVLRVVVGAHDDDIGHTILLEVDHHGHVDHLNVGRLDGAGGPAPFDDGLDRAWLGLVLANLAAGLRQTLAQGGLTKLVLCAVGPVEARPSRNDASVAEAHLTALATNAQVHTAANIAVARRQAFFEDALLADLAAFASAANDVGLATRCEQPAAACAAASGGSPLRAVATAAAPATGFLWSEYGFVATGRNHDEDAKQHGQRQQPHTHQRNAATQRSSSRGHRTRLPNCHAFREQLERCCGGGDAVNDSG